MRPALLAALLTAVALPALAQDKPLTFPTRDVSITYRFLGTPPGGQTLPEMTMSWIAASQVVRMDMGGMGWMVADHQAQRGFMVMDQARMVMEIPMAQVMRQAGPSPTATYRRTGSSSVAGLACDLWSFQDGANAGTACITADGVMLRAEGSSQGHAGGMEATAVTYGPQDPARFQRPNGYQTMQMPTGAPPGGRPPAR